MQLWILWEGENIYVYASFAGNVWSHDILLVHIIE